MKQREIKFRLYDKETEQVISFEDSHLSGEYIWQFNSKGGIEVLSSQTVDSCPGGLYHEQEDKWLPIDCVIMQFTGLYDKNNKPIYEGDVCIYNRGGVFQDDVYVSIIFHSGSFCCKSPMFNTALINEKMIHFEVKGNLYENPSLIPSNKKKR